jgi:hypothetical protein
LETLALISKTPRLNWKLFSRRNKQQEALQAGWDSYVHGEKKLQEYFWNREKREILMKGEEVRQREADEVIEEKIPSYLFNRF